ncbi:hypothetical protein A3D06_00625 [Candidatus Roizmanbacteria bacterium RIFCSPHIGHO2_02_FULL_40_9]|uniref:Uncharacterized protein n=1 Tax=Candidatus Roizmanbacteria bacterium RIFCSPHIGHO2_02_FULL_40_9 TaxID=1802042 RepID=A0A1F7HBT9_9BACT|nr:MAG: hypothetical protein A3D06_00625 [Candidatus Roizmanbacteria bacterium RIFCSPHIGHO2_02_FULL_40_9]
MNIVYMSRKVRGNIRIIFYLSFRTLVYELEESSPDVCQDALLDFSSTTRNDGAKESYDFFVKYGRPSAGWRQIRASPRAAWRMETDEKTSCFLRSVACEEHDGQKADQEYHHHGDGKDDPEREKSLIFVFG